MAIPDFETKRQDIVLNEGEDFNFVFTAYTNYTAGTVKDLTGYSFTWNILDQEGGTIIDSLNPELVTDGSDGKFRPNFTVAEIDALTVTDGFHELFAAVGGDNKKWLKGQFKVRARGTA